MVVHPPPSILLLVLNPYPIWNRSKLDGIDWYTVKPWKTIMMLEDMGYCWDTGTVTVDVDSEFCFSLSLLWGVPIHWGLTCLVVTLWGTWDETLDFMGWTSCWYQVWNELFIETHGDFYCWANHRCSFFGKAPIISPGLFFCEKVVGKTINFMAVGQGLDCLLEHSLQTSMVQHGFPQFQILPLTGCCFLPYS